MAKTKKNLKKKSSSKCVKCHKTVKGRKKRCKKCAKKKYKCCVKSRGRTRGRTRARTRARSKARRKRKYKKTYKNIRKYKQSGCSKQKGGYKCNEATNMGEIYGGNKLNLLTRDITRAKSTQNEITSLKGGGFAINAGLGKGIDVINSISNGIKNTINTAYGDHHVEDSDVTVAGDMMKHD